MTIRNHPDVQQTIPGKSREYRLYTIEDCDYGDFNDSLVTCTPWGVSYSLIYGQDGCTLKVYDVSGMPEEGVAYHEVDGTHHDTQKDAQRLAFEHGLLAYMVYEHPRD